MILTIISSRTYTARFFKFIFLLQLFFSSCLFAQNKAAKGMEPRIDNFSSFTEKSQKNSEIWKKVNLPEFYSHPEFGILPKDAPCTDCIEDLSKRKFDERYFVNVNDLNEYYLQKAMGQLHEQVNGQWLTIDHHLNPSQNGTFLSGCFLDQAGFQVNEKLSFLQVGSEKLHFNQWKLILKVNNELQEPLNANWDNYSVGEDGVRISEIFPGIDAEMRVLRGAIKTNFIIKKNEFGVFDELIFVDEFKYASEIKMSFIEGFETEGVGNVLIKSDDVDLAMVQQGIMYAKDGPKELYQDPVYRISENTLGVVVPFEWINENIDAYELIVDPLVTGTNTLAQASILGSQYNASCNFTNSCNANLVVARPANSTVTDVQWTFTYSASGICWREDGAIRIASGACVSPAAAGFYWFCNLPSGGNCAGTNISIMSDLGACMPAPSCVPVNVTFTLQFFRSCWGTTGCNNTCIAAASPWTMTITGRTIEYSNTTTPINLSATTVCQGQSVTASTTSTFGVPAFSYNWSFSPTGSPSVGTGASASITFPTAGSITLYSIVTDACGNQVNSSRVITVTASPTATATPASQSICTGQATSIALSSSIGGTTYTWTVVQSGVSGASNGSGSSIAQTLTATGASSGTATYTITPTAGGCPGAPITVVITVNPLPVVSVSSTSICTGGSAVLTASGATTYTWSPAATLSASTGTSVTASPTTNTTYTIVGTTGTCNGTTTATVTVIAPPVVNVNSTTICSGTSAVLTATGATTYTWTPSASLSSGTGTSVTASPPTTTTYTITGTSGSCSSTATSTVTVNPTPIVSVNSPTYCTGGSAVLTASGATTYSWSPATNLSASSGSSVTASPTTTTTYTVTGTTSGCSSTSVATVTVITNPVISVNSGTICNGSNIVLTASGATTYTWSPSSGLSATTGTSVTASPTSTTTYTVVGTSGTCSGTSTSTVTVNPNPVLSVNSPTICNGQTTTLTASGATTYTWSPATNLSATSGAVVNANPSTTTNYLVTGTTNGCSSTATSIVTVNPLPVITVNSGTICSGSSLTLNASGANTYTWSPSGSLSAASGSSVIATPTSTTSYTITGTTNGCSSTQTATVTVNPNPIVTVNPETICAGASISLTASGATSYSWSPAGTLSSNSGANVTATPSSTTVYTVTGTSLGCNGTATSSVTVVPNPVITVNSGTICTGSSINLNASGATTYSWSPATNLSASTGSSVVANPTTTTIYTVTGITNGCSSTANSTVTVNPIPTVTASNNGPVCSGQSVTFTATTTAGATYSWSGPNAYTSSLQNPVITNVGTAQVGIYTVTISLNGCTSTATTNFSLIPGATSAIVPSGPYCSNGSPVNLQSVSPGGVWSGSAITNTTLGTFDPSIATIGANPVTYTVSGACGTPTTINIQVNAAPVVNINASQLTGCSPLSVDFSNTSVPVSSNQLWDFGNGNMSTQANPTVVFTSDGCYDITLSVSDANGCSSSSIFSNFICVEPRPNAAFSVVNNELPVLNPTVQLINNSTNATNYMWYFGDGNTSQIESPTYTYSASSGSFLIQLVATNNAGCSDTTQQSVSIVDDLIFYIPNAFTPNGDESNNAFEPVFTSGIDAQNFNLTIFNRWGETVFETNDPKIGWDGTYKGVLVQEGIYTWTLRFKSPNNDKKQTFNGSVTVLK
jgi:gliding motility-associated-like protein